MDVNSRVHLQCRSGSYCVLLWTTDSARLFLNLAGRAASVRECSQSVSFYELHN